MLRTLIVVFQFYMHKDDLSHSKSDKLNGLFIYKKIMGDQIEIINLI
jgi:hypothetical protein